LLFIFIFSTEPKTVKKEESSENIQVKLPKRILEIGMISSEEFKGSGASTVTQNDVIQDGYFINKIEATSGDAIESLQTWTVNIIGSTRANDKGGVSGTSSNQ